MNAEDMLAELREDIQPRSISSPPSASSERQMRGH
jgi:hypothetical protein